MHSYPINPVYSTQPIEERGVLGVLGAVGAVGMLGAVDQSCYPDSVYVRRFLRRLSQKDDRLSWAEHLAMIRQLHQRERAIASCPISQVSKGTVIGYVANFKRPQNIESIVHSLLASPSIGRVIVSNNNPACDLSTWFTPMSERVTVLHHATEQSCSMRYRHLQDFPSPSYLILDDDVFLLPSQIESLIAELRNNPAVPHGLYGQRWEGGHFRGGIHGIEDEIDVISRIYAFTQQHLVEWHRLFTLMPQENTHLGYSDDVILSRSGSTLPRMHDAKPLVDCPSQGAEGIAMWRQDGFHAGREDLYRRLQQIKPFSS